MLQDCTMVIGERYRLLQTLYYGGMSEVVLAFDEQAHRQVAVKLVASDSPEYSLRLQREVAILRALAHPHILPLLDDGCTGAYCYLVMPYMRRGNLRERLARQTMTQQEAGNMLAQLAGALQCAHEHGIVHRDIKPSNVLLDTSDEVYVYLADFGLAKTLDVETGITQPGCLIGTPHYMAPELAEMPYSIHSDIYALGILLYQMLTGRLPFTGTDALAICWKHAQEPPLPPSSLNPHISRAVEQVILRALDKNPQHRFPDAQAMALAYTQALIGGGRQDVFPDPVTLSLPTIQVVQRKRDESRAAYKRRWLYGSWQARKKITVSLSMLVLMALPLSLGLLLGKDFTHSSSPVLDSDAVSGNAMAPAAMSQGKPAQAGDGDVTRQTGTTIDAHVALPRVVSGNRPGYTPPLPAGVTVAVRSGPAKSPGHLRGSHSSKAGHKIRAKKGKRGQKAVPRGNKKHPMRRKRGH
ncbi:MAG TPA: serine/threonine-protein kinase [Ktedonobacteraceae bacterium]|jgi:serine/threonine protein kinase|nr:serine/threonine-protein kinase [Ktedonobacteraceae bacterium]